MNNIRTAYNQLSQQQFVDWALNNNYDYFIVIEGNREYGWIYSKQGTTQYRFNYKTKNKW